MGTTTLTPVMNEYGGALYELAKEEKIAARVLGEIEELRGIFAAEPGYLLLMQTPGIPITERLSLLDGAFGEQIHPYLLNFMKILAKRRYFGEILGCFDRFESLYYFDEGILCANAVSALPLTDAQRERLLQVLEKKTGKKIRLTEKVDETLIGGLRLEIDGKLYDGSIRSRFDGLADALRNATL